MIVNLTESQKNLLKYLQGKLNDDKTEAFRCALQGNVEMLHVDTLCDLINQEFMMEGIDENFEPNQYGIELEELLDAINKPRVSG
ncbi:hypothetical protein [Herbaspirillum rubrisubalbicans]|uniref:Uncharacterized protein n=1 Tax=Herbaspirillum rubrisubalbicans TaxID=80842 RepID=A0AAD0UDE3_9BURK|nr:hypothetical protein [Herbaspirillum rubrisubalbicans]AYR26761.1 hypothetical protein RC54_24335 [Herbaspirillum rubrisubalbicans]